MSLSVFCLTLRAQAENCKKIQFHTWADRREVKREIERSSCGRWEVLLQAKPEVLSKLRRLGSSVVERSPEEAGVVSSILTQGTTRLWFNGRTLPCQGRDTGSIPVSRSIKTPNFRGFYVVKSRLIKPLESQK